MVTGAWPRSVVPTPELSGGGPADVTPRGDLCRHRSLLCPNVRATKEVPDGHTRACTDPARLRSWLGRDAVAGLVLSLTARVPGMAYAELAGLPAVTGLYTSILCLVGYALAGPHASWCWGRTPRSGR